MLSDWLNGHLMFTVSQSIARLYGANEPLPEADQLNPKGILNLLNLIIIASLRIFDRLN